MNNAFHNHDFFVIIRKHYNFCLHNPFERTKLHLHIKQPSCVWIDYYVVIEIIFYRVVYYITILSIRRYNKGSFFWSCDRLRISLPFFWLSQLLNGVINRKRVMNVFDEGLQSYIIALFEEKTFGSVRHVIHQVRLMWEIMLWMCKHLKFIFWQKLY
jgi:hypothetical protein